jgi:PAS domain S-box-containing protein
MFEDIVETVRQPLIVLDSDLRVVSANRSFYGLFKVRPEETVGNLIYDLGNRQWDITGFRTLLEDIIPENNSFDDYEVEHIFSGVGHKIMLLNARRIIHKEIGAQMILLAIEDITERKRMERLLEANEAKYQELVQNVNSIILKMDTEGKVTFFNKFAQMFFDYTEKEMLGRHVVGTIVPETESDGLDLDFMIKDIEINPEKYNNNENENMRRNGERVWVAWTNKAIRDGTGKVTAILCIGNDITERRRMETELKDYEERFRRLFETSKDGLLLIDKQTGDIVNVNPAIVEMLGYCSEEFIGKKPEDIGLLKEIKDFKDTIEELIQAGFINYEDVFAETKQGQLISVDIHLVDRARFIQCNVRDVTERKKAEEALQESKDKISQILNSTAEGIYGLDLSGNCVFCNPASIRILGYHDENDIKGKNMHDLIQHTKADGTPYLKEECTILKAFQKGEYIHSDNELFLRSDGKGFPVEYWTYPILKDDRVTGAVVSFIDITDRITLENQFFQAQKMEAVGQLAGGVAHDFNNILTGIICFGDLALMKMAKDDPQRINIEHMLEGAARAAHLTKDLLLFSRKQVSEKRPVDLNAIIKKMEKFLTRIIGEDTSCKTILHPAAMPVMADAHQLEQVMMNLATNARDAMPQGGVFSVTTEQIRFDKEFITAYGYGQPGKYALITVSDTGKGMDETTRQRIFEPFFTTKEMGKGTGLGMAVVYGIVKGHDGHINIYSEPGVGTTFRIYLPLTTMEEEVAQESIQPLALGKGETILIAEDEPRVREVLRLSLEEYGYKVIATENGEDAVKQYRDNMEKVSLVLLDVIMPVKNGRETCDEIKHLKPDTKVIFMSGHTEDIITTKGMLEAGTEFISKPITPDRLLRKVRELLDRQNPTVRYP